jgi:hypothetical protein
MLKFSARPLSASAWRVRAIKLGLVASPVVAAYFYSHTQYSSPFFCPIKALTGIPCPGCGMTRSFIAIAQGNLQGAVAYHLFGIPLFLGLLIATVHLSLELITQRRVMVFYNDLIRDKKLQLLLSSGIFIYYFIRLYTGEIHEELLLNVQDSPVGKLILKLVN